MTEPSNFITLGVSDLESTDYDIQICALGYEARSTAIAKRTSASRKIVFGFDHGHQLSYPANFCWFKSNGFVVHENVKSTNFGICLSDALGEAISDLNGFERVTRIAVDISCFDRYRLAEIIGFFRSARIRNVEVDYWYSIAAFLPPSPNVGRNEVAGPVHKRFAGRFTEPGRPLALVAGLGYEPGRVVGAAEYLQASKVIALVPESPVVEYEKEVLNANSTILCDIEPRQILRYPVDDPVRTIALLDAVIRGLSMSYNIVMLPGGPKIFALNSLIVQSMHPTCAVWRISSAGSISPRDISSSDYTVGLKVKLP